MKPLLAFLLVLGLSQATRIEDDLAALNSFLESQGSANPMTTESVDEIMDRLKSRWRDEDFSDAQSIAQCRAQLAALQSLVDDNHDTLITEKSQLLGYEAEQKLIESELKNTQLQIRDKEKAAEVVHVHMEALGKARERAHSSFLRRQTAITKSLSVIGSFISRESELDGKSFISLSESMQELSRAQGTESESIADVQAMVASLQQAVDPAKKAGDSEIVRLLNQLNDRLKAYKTRIETREAELVKDFNSVVASYKDNQPASQAALAALKTTLKQAERHEQSVKVNIQHLHKSIDETEEEIHHLTEQYNALLKDCRAKHVEHAEGAKQRANELEIVQRVQKIIFERMNKPIKADTSRLTYGVDLPELRAPPEKSLGLPGCVFPYSPTKGKDDEKANKATSASASASQAKANKKGGKGGKGAAGKDDEEDENRDSHEFTVDHSRVSRPPTVTGDQRPPGLQGGSDHHDAKAGSPAAVKAAEQAKAAEKAKATSAALERLRKELSAGSSEGSDLNADAANHISDESPEKAAERAKAASKSGKHETKKERKERKAKERKERKEQKAKKLAEKRAEKEKKRAEKLKERERKRAEKALAREERKLKKELGFGSDGGENIDAGAANHISDESPEKREEAREERQKRKEERKKQKELKRAVSEARKEARRETRRIEKQLKREERQKQKEIRRQAKEAKREEARRRRELGVGSGEGENIDAGAANHVSDESPEKRDIESPSKASPSKSTPTSKITKQDTKQDTKPSAAKQDAKPSAAKHETTPTSNHKPSKHNDQPKSRSNNLPVKPRGKNNKSRKNKPSKPLVSDKKGIAVFKHYVGANMLEGTNLNGALTALPWDENSRAASQLECQNRCAAQAQCGAYVYHPGSYPAPWSFICILKQTPAPSVDHAKKWSDFGGIHVGVRVQESDD